MSGFFTTRLLFETNFSEVPLSPSAKQPLRATTSPASTKYLGGCHRRYDELFVEIGGFNMVNMVVKIHGIKRIFQMIIFNLHV